MKTSMNALKLAAVAASLAASMGLAHAQTSPSGAGSTSGTGSTLPGMAPTTPSDGMQGRTDSPARPGDAGMATERTDGMRRDGLNNGSMNNSGTMNNNSGTMNQGTTGSGSMGTGTGTTRTDGMGGTQRAPRADRG